MYSSVVSSYGGYDHEIMGEMGEQIMGTWLLNMGA
jgi:hypothetical protein